MTKKSFQLKARGITPTGETFERSGVLTINNFPETFAELVNIFGEAYILDRLPTLIVYHDNLGSARRALAAETEAALINGAKLEELPAWSAESELRPGGQSGPTKAELAWAKSVMASPEAIAKATKMAKTLGLSDFTPTETGLAALKREIDRNLA